MSKLDYLRKHYGYGKKKKKKKKRKKKEISGTENILYLQDNNEANDLMNLHGEEYTPVFVNEEKNEETSVIVTPRNSTGSKTKNDWVEIQHEKGEGRKKIEISQNEKNEDDNSDDDDDDDLSPVRKRHDSDDDDDDDDLSPVRKRHDSDDDEKNDKEDESGDLDVERNRERHDSDDEDEMEGKIIPKKRKRSDDFESSEVSKKRKKNEVVHETSNNETIFRNSNGSKISKDEYFKIKEQKKKPLMQHQKDMFWSKGIVQIENSLKKIEKSENEKDKNFVPKEKDEIDEEMDQKLRKVIHIDDPMAEYEREKREKKMRKKLLKKMKKMKKKGKVRHERRFYNGNFPPNRFNIQPGWRWDGCVRSTGFEKKIFQYIQKSEKSKPQTQKKF